MSVNWLIYIRFFGVNLKKTIEKTKGKAVYVCIVVYCIFVKIRTIFSLTNKCYFYKR